MSLDLSWELDDPDDDYYSYWEDVYERISERGYTVDGEEDKIPLIKLNLYQSDLSSWEGFRPGSLRYLYLDNNHIQSWKHFDPGNLEELSIVENEIDSWEGFHPGRLRKLDLTGNPIKSWQGFCPGELKTLFVRSAKIASWEGFRCGNIRYLNVDFTKISWWESNDLGCMRFTRYPYTMGHYDRYDRYIGSPDMLRTWLVRWRALRRWIHMHRARRICALLGFNTDSTFYRDLIAEMERDWLYEEQ